jgi:ubiquinol-cytochrome c reductase cytochrome c subunit
MKNLPSKAVGVILVSIPLVLVGQKQDSAISESGKRLYIRNGCYECHGYEGQGGSAGPRIGSWSFGAEALISYVRHPAGQMPPYTEKVMSDQELSDIAAYLKSIPQPRPASEIPLLSGSQSK